MQLGWRLDGGRPGTRSHGAHICRLEVANKRVSASESWLKEVKYEHRIVLKKSETFTREEYVQRVLTSIQKYTLQCPGRAEEGCGGILAINTQVSNYTLPYDDFACKSAAAARVITLP